LYGETNPEEDIELDKALENLIDGKHLLDPPISSKELVHLPAKLVIYRPCECDIGKLCDSDDNWKDCREGVDGDM
jgi:hypothetical protein